MSATQAGYSRTRQLEKYRIFKVTAETVSSVSQKAGSQGTFNVLLKITSEANQPCLGRQTKISENLEIANGRGQTETAPNGSSNGCFLHCFTFYHPIN